MTFKRSERIFAGVALLPLSVGTIAYTVLKTPFAIECLNVNEHSKVSARLHCAQLKAERQTPENLVSAIDLIRSTPPEDPQYEESNRLIERWSIELFNQAEAAYQAGNLEQAIEIAESLPSMAPNVEATKERIRAWKITWTRAEVMEQEATALMEKREWYQAFQLANRLRQLGNEYWAAERRTLLVEQIQSDRELRDWRLKQPLLAAKPKPIQITPPKKPIQRPSQALGQPADDATADRPAQVTTPAAIAPPEPIQPPAIVPESTLPATEPPKIEPIEPTPDVELVTPVVELETETRSSNDQL